MTTAGAAGLSARELAVGVGCRPGTPAADIVAAVRAVLGEHRCRRLATLDRRVADSGMPDAAVQLGVPLLAYPPDRLAAVSVPNPSARVAAATGATGIAEAAARLAAAGGPLVLAKTVVGGVTVAAAACA
ncbi:MULTISPECIES: cobalamin biosynthesis protein [Nocardia]|uniref:cobalamin biosynthesis protein n=1 Tax=Nocardia TaxID=1817 RepID=UPI000C01C115|nr:MULTISPECIES: cobalamin biosynthesis protein [Nocardia]MCZ9330124.1 cobalamin biosynthesis protein [Nocardia farcinica]PFX00600.1 Cobalt-precorrin-5A hydrolase [Nocardia farcinica]PFX08153.1 Cobalt-precorrin-5A hydrolase [Nocardia farcinica]UEX21437.1 cobalamin biosynthesis protein [Nocardia farcinica]